MGHPQQMVSRPIHLRLPSSLRMDDEQFFAFCQANTDYRIERTAGGEIDIMPPTGGETGRRNSDLVTDLNLWARQDGNGIVFDSSTGFRLPDGSTRSPDAAWVLHERLTAIEPADKERFLPLAPDFVVELASLSDDIADLNKKMQEYRANGVRLGWLLVPATRQVRIYRPGALPTRLDAPEALDGGGVLLGFTLNLRKIWEPAF